MAMHSWASIILFNIHCQNHWGQSIVTIVLLPGRGIVLVGQLSYLSGMQPGFEPPRWHLASNEIVIGREYHRENSVPSILTQGLR
jgi:hypothetical protein